MPSGNLVSKPVYFIHCEALEARCLDRLFQGRCRQNHESKKNCVLWCHEEEDSTELCLSVESPRASFFVDPLDEIHLDPGAAEAG